MPGRFRNPNLLSARSPPSGGTEEGGGGGGSVRVSSGNLAFNAFTCNASRSSLVSTRWTVNARLNAGKLVGNVRNRWTIVWGGGWVMSSLRFNASRTQQQQRFTLKDKAVLILRTSLIMHHQRMGKGRCRGLDIPGIFRCLQ